MNSYLTTADFSIRDQRVVHIEFECLKVGEIDTMNEKYYAEFLFTISWSENKLISVYDKKKDWNPMIYIDNVIGKSEEIVEYKLKPFKNNSCTVVFEKKLVKVFILFKTMKHS